jgi:hypothetical protein
MKTIAAICAFCLFAILGAITVSCKDARDQYYAALNNCTAKNGTWVPSRDSTANSGMCIYPH